MTTAAVTTTDELGSLPDAQKAKANQGIGSAFEAGFAAQVALAFPTMPTLQRAAFTASLKTAFRSKLGGMFGVTVATGAGGGGAVGGGSTLKATIGFSTGAAATAGVKFSTAAAAKLKANLGGVIAQGLLSAGLTAQQRSAVSRQLEPELGSALDTAARSSLGPDPGYPNGSAHPVIRAEVSMQLHKEWDADADLDVPDDQDPPTGPFILNLEGVEFRGTIVPARSGRYGGRTRVKIVGGAGGLTTELQPKNYAAGVVTVRLVLGDILRESGESLSPDATDPVLDQQLPGWQRGAGQGRDHLTVLADRVGASWRVLRDGNVWFGTEGWPEVEINDPVVEEHHGEGFMASAPAQPLTYPGTVIRGQRVEQVVHRIDRSGLRSEHHARSVRSGLRKFTEELTRATDYTKRYRAKVVRVRDDGTVDIITDDARMQGQGIGQCDIRMPAPGMTLIVKPGARCLVGWEDGDPSLPYASCFAQGATDALVSLQVGANARGVAHVGSTVSVLFPPIMPFNGTVGGVPAAGVLTIIDPGVAVVEDGSPSLLV